MDYKINEIFESLQGEGLNLGKRTIFIRLSGCNLNCEWCDTDHADYKKMSLKGINTLIEQVRMSNTKNIIITGGEPTIQDILPLVVFLESKGYWIGLETNGTGDLTHIRRFIDYIAISPKPGSILHDSARYAQEIRVVNTYLTLKDILFLDWLPIPNKYISVFDNAGDFNLVETIELLGEVNERVDQKWRLNQQFHKLLHIR